MIFFRSILLGFILSGFACNGLAQSEEPPGFLSIAYIKSRSDDFLQNEKQFWLPVHQQMVKEGKKQAWLLYRVKYPEGTSAPYNYVRFNLLKDWRQAENYSTGLDRLVSAVHQGKNLRKALAKTEASRDIVWTQLFELLGQANNDITKPAKFIVVNAMKLLPGAQARYLELERDYFMPFHAERARRGVMNNWQLYRALMPYGEKYESDYVTFNGFDNWEDIRKSNPPDIWKTVHGKVEFDKVHDEILELRITVNNELWELVAYTR